MQTGSLAAARAALLALLFVCVARASGTFPADVLIVAAQCHEDVTWLRSALPAEQLVSCVKLSCLRDEGMDRNATYDERCSQESRDGVEFASYLRFIVSRLEANDTLPEWLAFVHGHRVAWHHGASAGLLNQIQRARLDRQEVSFINLNELFTGPLEQEHVDSLRSLWERELERYLGAFPCAAVNAPCCAQFLVRSERVRAVPLDAWRTLLHVTMRGNDPDYKTKLPGAEVGDLKTAFHWDDFRQLEFIWHLLLGEPCVSPVTDGAAYERAMFDERPLVKAAARPRGTWHAEGCYKDAPNEGRIMGANGELKFHGTYVRTPRGCQSLALDNSMDTAGMEGDECWACSGCDYTRHGKLEACSPLGGPWEMQVFRFRRSAAADDGGTSSSGERDGLSLTKTPLFWAHMGCFGDAQMRVISTELQDGGKHPADAQACQALAAARGFNTIGLAHGEECWACLDCAYDALGEIAEGCPPRGGAWTLQVYVMARLQSSP